MHTYAHQTDTDDKATCFAQLIESLLAQLGYRMALKLQLAGADD